MLHTNGELLRNIAARSSQLLLSIKVPSKMSAGKERIYINLKSAMKKEDLMKLK